VGIFQLQFAARFDRFNNFSRSSQFTSLTFSEILFIFEEMLLLINWLETHQLPCFYKHYLGVDCPGCGMQTAFILLLKGQLLKSIIAYPALLPTLFMICFLILHLFYNFKKGAVILKISFIFTVAIMVFNYIIKILTI
jgi:hypothetical protein